MEQNKKQNKSIRVRARCAQVMGIGILIEL